MASLLDIVDPRRFFLGKQGGGNKSSASEIAIAGGNPSSIYKLKQLLNNHRLADLLPYESYDETTGLYHNVDSIGIVLEVPPMTGAGEETVKIIGGLFSQNLPTGIGIQFCIVASSNIMPRMMSWANERLKDEDSEEYLEENHRPKRNDNIYRRLVRKRIDYLMTGARKSLFANQPYLVRDYRVIVSLTFPQKETFSESKIFNIRDAVRSTLNAAALPSQEMKPTEFINLMDEILNPLEEPHKDTLEWNPGKLIKDQLTNSEKAYILDKDTLVINETEVRSYSVRSYPRYWAMWGMTDLIGDTFLGALRIPCPFIFTFGVMIPDQDNLQRTAMVKQARATQTSESVMAKFIPIMKDQKHDWDFVQKELQSGGSLVKAYHQIVIFPKAGEGALAEQTLKSLFRSKTWALQNDRFMQIQGLMSALPMSLSEELAWDLTRMGRMVTMLTSTASNMLPIIGEWKGTGTPSLMLLGRRGQIQFVDPFDNNAGNYNIAIAAASGAGKSFATQEIVVSTLGRGGRVFVIDVGRSYQRTCEMLGGQFIEFSEDANININPFSQISLYDKKTGELSDRPFNEALPILKPLIAQMAVTARDTDDLENSYIEQAIRHAWSEKSVDATVTDVADYLKMHEDQRAKDLGTMLFPYTSEGSYARFFEGKANLDFSNKFIVLELDDLKSKKDLQSVVLMILMFQVTQTMYLGDRKTQTMCIIDEAWSLLAGGNKEAASFIENGYRTARKYGGAFCCVTQGINDFYKSAAAEAALVNSDWLFLLRQKKESIDQLQDSKRVSMDPYILKLMKSVTTVHGEFSEMLVYGPGGYSIGRLIVDPYTEVLYSTKASEFARAKELQDQGMSLSDALEVLVKERLER